MGTQQNMETYATGCSPLRRFFLQIKKNWKQIVRIQVNMETIRRAAQLLLSLLPGGRRFS